MHHSGVSHYRRQQRIVVPALFEAATSGNFAHAAEVLEEGDDLDAKVICLISTQFSSSSYICHVLVYSLCRMKMEQGQHMWLLAMAIWDS